MRQDIDAMDARLTEISASLSDDRQRLTDLLLTAESDIAELQAALDDAAALLHRNSADLGLQLDQLSTEVDDLRGQIEHTDFRLNQLQEQLNLFMEDIDLRLTSGRR